MTFTIGRLLLTVHHVLSVSRKNTFYTLPKFEAGIGDIVRLRADYLEYAFAQIRWPTLDAERNSLLYVQVLLF
jgi:hypothetical protein